MIFIFGSIELLESYFVESASALGASLLRRLRAAQADAPAIPRATAQESGSIAPPPPPEFTLRELRALFELGSVLFVLSKPLLLFEALEKLLLLSEAERALGSANVGAGCWLVGRNRSEGRLLATLLSAVGFADWIWVGSAVVLVDSLKFEGALLLLGPIDARDCSRRLSSWIRSRLRAESSR